MKLSGNYLTEDLENDNYFNKAKMLGTSLDLGEDGEYMANAERRMGKMGPMSVQKGLTPKQKVQRMMDLGISDKRTLAFVSGLSTSEVENMM